MTGTIRCYKCTRELDIPGQDAGAIGRIAHDIGWRENELGAVCPFCPGGASRMERVSYVWAVQMEAERQTLAKLEAKAVCS